MKKRIKSYFVILAVLVSMSLFSQKAEAFSAYTTPQDIAFSNPLTYGVDVGPGTYTITPDGWWYFSSSGVVTPFSTAYTSYVVSWSVGSASGGGSCYIDGPIFENICTEADIMATYSSVGFTLDFSDTLFFTTSAHSSETIGAVGLDVAVVTPEPSTYLLLGSGLVGLAYVRRRFKK